MALDARDLAAIGHLNVHALEEPHGLADGRAAVLGLRLVRGDVAACCGDQGKRGVKARAVFSHVLCV